MAGATEAAAAGAAAWRSPGVAGATEAGAVEGGRQPVGRGGHREDGALAAPPRVYEPGTKIARFDVEWLVVIEPAAKPEGAEGGGK